eukprot:TRINITY_DN726_c0_g1_i1.p1 TRINITY_DN726_c0_g1~~TRINITY_DN726_c0_g1_i1.p1  ORF type:complete len:326 (-),score=49.74 TRINITY_DN726_c0_g1_i1:814-1791(-)
MAGAVQVQQNRPGTLAGSINLCLYKVSHLVSGGSNTGSATDHTDRTVALESWQQLRSSAGQGLVICTAMVVAVTVLPLVFLFLAIFGVPLAGGYLLYRTVFGTKKRVEGNAEHKYIVGTVPKITAHREAMEFQPLTREVIGASTPAKPQKVSEEIVHADGALDGRPTFGSSSASYQSARPTLPASEDIEYEALTNVLMSPSSATAKPSVEKFEGARKVYLSPKDAVETAEDSTREITEQSKHSDSLPPQPAPELSDDVMHELQDELSELEEVVGVQQIGQNRTISEEIAVVSGVIGIDPPVPMTGTRIEKAQSAIHALKAVVGMT